MDLDLSCLSRETIQHGIVSLKRHHIDSRDCLFLSFSFSHSLSLILISHRLSCLLIFRVSRERRYSAVSSLPRFWSLSYLVSDRLHRLSQKTSMCIDSSDCLSLLSHITSPFVRQKTRERRYSAVSSLPRFWSLSHISYHIDCTVSLNRHLFCKRVL